MSDFNFNCPHCKQSLEAPAELLGQQINCPTCNGAIQLPKPQQSAPPPPAQAKKQMLTRPPNTSGDTRPCPYCGEPILRSAEKCRHCGEFLRGEREVKTNVKQGALIGAVACFIIGIILMLFSLWTFIMYTPLGILMLLLTVIVPPLLFIGLGAIRGIKTLDEVSKSMEQASAEVDKSLGTTVSTPLTPTKPASDVKKEQQAYIQFVDLYDFTAKHYESLLDGKVPGVEFKLRNRGNRSLKSVEVTVYFQDANGNTIAEENYFPVNTSSWMEPGKPLKPQYVWQMERGKFYTANNVPDEWQEGKATAKITEIEFE
ncbi:MAG: hypothetical protein BWY82_00756 [Verrucomicrobia bacterium ADurb.Bin474]|nr:MAG: hypothetical protein BWY82_00756 [Verrucomicrobia bacterium ADurb.Bin474]